MFEVCTTDPKLERFAKHYEAALNRYFEAHPEMVEEVERLTTEAILAYWRELGFEIPVQLRNIYSSKATPGSTIQCGLPRTLPVDKTGKDGG